MINKHRDAPPQEQLGVVLPVGDHAWPLDVIHPSSMTYAKRCLHVRSCAGLYKGLNDHVQPATSCSGCSMPAQWTWHTRPHTAWRGRCKRRQRQPSPCTTMGDMPPTAVAQTLDQLRVPTGWGQCSTVALQCTYEPTPSTVKPLQHAAARHAQECRNLSQRPGSAPMPAVAIIHAGTASAALLHWTCCAPPSDVQAGSRMHRVTWGVRLCTKQGCAPAAPQGGTAPLQTPHSCWQPSHTGAACRACHCLPEAYTGSGRGTPGGGAGPSLLLMHRLAHAAVALQAPCKLQCSVLASNGPHLLPPDHGCA